MNSLIPASNIVHVISPYRGTAPLARRQKLFLESIASADKAPVTLLAITPPGWEEAGWLQQAPQRDASAVGDPSDKPFLLDLFDAAFRLASPNDWLLYSNVDCCFAPDLYLNLSQLRGSVVEYMRQDVDGDPQTLEEVFSNPRESQRNGLDAMAIRASYYADVRHLLHNFVVGEPHWDTAYSAVFRDRIPVHRDSERLFHPRHDQVWDLSNPTPAAKHNHKLFVDAMLHSAAEKTMIEETRTATDTAVIIATFGSDPLRLDAHSLAIRNQLRQDLLTDIFVVELMFPGQPSGLPEALRPEVHYVPVPGDDSHKDLFQKEALWNYGWRYAKTRGNYDYYLFLDADVFCPDPTWHRAIRERLRENPARAVHSFDVVIDTVDEHYKMSGIASTFLRNRPNDLTVNPGIGWGLHRLLLEMGDGFNPLSFGHAGDSLFVSEYLNTPAQQYDPYLNIYHWFDEVRRTLPFRAEMDFVPYTVSHAYHGPVIQRDMKWLRVAIDGLGPLHEWLQLDSNGLQQWKQPDGPQHRIIQQRSCFESEESVAEVFAGHTYPRRTPRSAADASPQPDRPVFVPLGWSAPPGLAQADNELEVLPPSNRFHVFNPLQVFRDNYPFSWCDGIIKRPDSTHVPMRTMDGVPTLVLDALPGGTSFIAVLPIEANWAPQDLSAMQTLSLWLSLDGKASLALMSKPLHGEEVATSEVKLPQSDGGKFAISLADWPRGNDFDFTRVRLLRVIGQPGTQLKLRHIEIT